MCAISIWSVAHAVTWISKAFCSCLHDKSGPSLICILNYKVPIQTYGVIALFNPSRCLIQYSCSNLRYVFEGSGLSLPVPLFHCEISRLGSSLVMFHLKKYWVGASCPNMNFHCQFWCLQQLASSWSLERYRFLPVPGPYLPCWCLKYLRCLKQHLLPLCSSRHSSVMSVTSKVVGKSQCSVN